MRWHDLRDVAGQGLEGIDAAGRRWRLGTAGWAGAPGSPDTTARIEVEPSAGAQTCLGCDGQPLLRFVFDERLRDDAVAAVRALQADGVRVRLLSGDPPSQAQHMASLLGLASDGTVAASALSPADKLAAVRAEQQRGEVVGMLGDGINDAPAARWGVFTDGDERGSGRSRSTRWRKELCRARPHPVVVHAGSPSRNAGPGPTPTHQRPLEGEFQRAPQYRELVHGRLPVLRGVAPIGGDLRRASQISLDAASSLGKCPRVLMILRSRALMLSMALVV